ncbi:mammalian cell entry protein [Mycobacterium sp. E796]|nr:mammalian cell entry protein [Mycobacterium sp. E796]
MRIRDFATFVAFAAMIILGVGYIWSLGVRVAPPADRTNLSMQVADINGILLDSNVLLRGVPVGKVTGIHSSLQEATIDFYIDGRYQVPVDSEVRLENLSALGEPYIGLVPRVDHGPMLRDGQRIATQRIVQPPSISELAVSVTRLLNQADPQALKRVVNELDTGLPQPDTVLPNLSRTAMLLRNVAADMNGRGRILLDNFQALLQNASWVGPWIADITPGFRTIGLSAGVLFSGLEIDRPLGGVAIYDTVNRLIDRIQKLLDDRGGDIKVLGQALLPHLQGIAGSLMNFDTGQMLSNVLESVPADGTITLNVSIP